MKELIIWSAGLFDGEGCITSSKQCNLFTLCCILTMTCRETVDRFHRITGVGTVCSIPAKGKWKAKWQFQAVHEDAVHIANLLLPYSVTKRKQLELAVEYGEKCIDREIRNRRNGESLPESIRFHRQFIYEELRELNA